MNGSADAPVRSRRLWPVAAAIAALAAALLWIGTRSADRPRPPRMDDDLAAGSASHEASPDPVTARAETAGQPARSPVEPPASAVPSASPAGVQVTVLDAEGTPVPGVDVEVTARMAGAGTSPSRLARAATDARGRAALVVEPEKQRSFDVLGLTLEFEVRADVPLSDPPRAKIGDVRGAEPVVLRLREFGTAAVRVTGPAGGAVDDGGRVYLFWRTPGSDGRWEREGIPSASSAGGVARFEIVPLDRELLFRATGGGSFAAGETTVLGPARARQSVEATIRLGPALPVVVGRLVDETGAALAGAKVSIGVGSVPRDAPPDALPERNWIAYRWHTTDANGGFRMAFDLRRDPERRRVLAVEQDDSRRPGGGEIVRRALVALDFELRSGADNDLGTIPVVPDAEERFLVDGRVVDGHGEPLPNVDVSAGFRDRAAGKWQGLHRSRIRSGPDGRFEIRTTADPPPAFSVSASAHERVPTSREAAPGTRDVELVLRRGGRLEAWIRVPDGVPAYHLVGRIGRGEPDQFAGRFGYDNLPPGRHDVTVRIRDTSWEIARIEGVVVPDGGVADDPRLDGIEVRCRTLRLLVVDASGKPIADARLFVEDGDGRGGSLKTDADGRALAVVPSTVDAFVIRGHEGAHAEIAWSAGEQTVRIAR